MLGVDDPFMVRMVELVVELMGDAYRELDDQHELIERIVASEEERFGATLRQGLSFLEGELAALESAGQQQLAGETAFVLHDTYGFPLELTTEIVAERGLEVDLDRFHSEMEAQRERARAHVKDESWSTFGGLFSDLAKRHGPTEFVGYELDEAEATVLADRRRRRTRRHGANRHGRRGGPRTGPRSTASRGARSATPVDSRRRRRSRGGRRHPDPRGCLQPRRRGHRGHALGRGQRSRLDRRSASRAHPP